MAPTTSAPIQPGPAGRLRIVHFPAGRFPRKVSVGAPEFRVTSKERRGVVARPSPLAFTNASFRVQQRRKAPGRCREEIARSARFSLAVNSRWAISNASYKKQRRNQGVTEIVEIPKRGHALTIDNGWRDVCDKALEFVKRFT